MKNEEVLSWLKTISEHLGTIGNELRHIRNLLEPRVSSLPQNDSGCDLEDLDKNQTEVIPLDLEAFANQIKRNQG